MADANEDTTNLHPSQVRTKEAVIQQAKVAEQRKADAATDEHELRPNSNWKKQFAIWANADHELKCDIVYGMVFHDGAYNVKDITRFFNIKADELKPFAHIVDAAKAALKLKIQRNQISLGLQREDNPSLKFNLQKQFAEQVNDPAHEGVASVDNSEVRVNIQVLKPEDAITVGEQVGAALNKTLQ
jgi:hypothetical protein